MNKAHLEQSIDYWLERVGLTADQHQMVHRYSKGMKQRLHIARTLLHDPELIFMDEPTLGLDPKGTLELRGIIKELKSQGKTIILTTHDMQEAQELCDEIAFIMDGQIITQGTLQELQDQFQDAHQYEIELLSAPHEGLIAAFGDQADLVVQEDKTYLLRIDIPKGEGGQERIKQIVAQLAPLGVSQMIRKKLDLRSIYLQLVDPKKNKQEYPVSV